LIFNKLIWSDKHYHYELGKEYRLDKNTIKKYFNLDQVENGIITLNYFSITVLLYYIKNIRRYDEIKHILRNHIQMILYRHNKEDLCKNTKYVLLLFDIIACPYLGIGYKKELLNHFGVVNNQNNIIKREKFWFTKWSDFNFVKEIEAKKSQEVYS
jgi:hypothetical protein